MSSITSLDIAALVLYFVLVLGVSLYSMYKHNRSNVQGYFLAGRNMIWLYVGASLFASNIGSEHFIGLAGSGAASGYSVGAFELNAMIVIQLLGWVFLPVFISSGVATLPEYMNKRFGGKRIRVYLACLSLVLYIFTKISVNLYSGALFIKLALNWNLYYSVFFILAMTAFCTISGGLAAVIYTDTLQTLIMLLGGMALMIISFNRIGGFMGLYEKYMLAIPQYSLNANSSDTYASCGIPNEKSFTMLRGITDIDMPWLGFILGQTPASVWYWCSDQMMVQRTLAAKNLSHAQGGTLFAGYIKILPFFMMVIPGMISRILFTEQVACADPDTCFTVCESRTGCSNLAYPLLIMNIMPSGLRGIMIAVMLAALMSDLTSIFNSASTLFTIDIYQQFKKNVSNFQLMIAGRLFVGFMVLVGVLWIPIIQNMQGGQLYIYIQSIAAYLSPPIAAVYVLAIMWKRANEKGAFSGLMVGMLVGVIRMTLDFSYPASSCGEVDNRPSIVKNFHYMYFAMLLFWLTAVTVIVVSLMSEPNDAYRTIRTTYWTYRETTFRPDDKQTKISETKSIYFINSQQPLAKIDMSDEVIIRSSKKSICKKIFLNWICGLNEKESMVECDESLLKSVEQTKLQKFILNINLVIIILVAIALFIYFSVPPTSNLYTIQD